MTYSPPSCADDVSHVHITGRVPTRLPVFVVHWRSPASCLQTVSTLRAQTIPLQITVLDNCSPDAEVRPLKEAGFDLEILPRNLGYGGAANHALRQWLCSTDTPYAVVCPHDALPSANCVELILKAMHERPRAGI